MCSGNEFQMEGRATENALAEPRACLCYDIVCAIRGHESVASIGPSEELNKMVA